MMVSTACAARNACGCFHDSNGSEMPLRWPQARVNEDTSGANASLQSQVLALQQQLQSQSLLIRVLINPLVRSRRHSC